MGLFGGGNTTTTQQFVNDTTNNDNRIGVDNGILIDSGSYTGDTSTVDNHGITTTDNHSVTISSDSGAIRAGQTIAERALELADANTKSAIDAANRATRDLAAGQAAANSAISSATASALDAVRSNASKSLDVNERITGLAIGGFEDANIRGLNFASDIFGEALHAVADSSREQTAASQRFVGDFTAQVATANQTESQQKFDKIAQLVTVVAVVAGVIAIARA